MSVLDKDTNLRFPNVLVIDASAGSGKTHTLAHRFVQLILSDKISQNQLDNVIAITFTNNAAREMKQRILDFLKQFALNNAQTQILELISLSPDELPHKAEITLENILSNYSDFHIQTIDSFMNRILRSSVIEFENLPPDIEVTQNYNYLIDYTTALMLKNARENMLKSFETELTDFLELLVQEKNSFPWRAADKIKEEFKKFLSKEGKVLEEIMFEDRSSVISDKFTLAAEAYNKLIAAGLENKIRKPIHEAFKENDPKKLILNYSPELSRLKAEQKELPELKEWADLAPVIAEMAENFSLSKYQHYGTLYSRFKNLLARVKNEKEIIHIDDINKELSKYINRESVPEIYYRLGDILYHFMIDEFQDTDKVQWENMKPLIEEALSKEGSLFTVGDLKQAIYMFRNADYKIMRNIVTEIKTQTPGSYLPYSTIPNAKIISLEQNYRSGGAILQYVEEMFKNRLKNLLGTEFLTEDRTGLTDYLQSPIENKTNDGYVETRIISTENEGREKDYLLNIIADAVKRGYKYRDIAVLTRKNDEVKTAVEWLTEKNIPAASFSSLDIRMRKIIMEISSLLKFLDSPVDNLAFATFIAGDMFKKSANVKRENIFNFIKSSKENKLSDYLYAIFRETAEFTPLWNRFFEDIYNKVGYYPVYDLVSLIFRTFDIFENFKEEASVLLKFLEAISEAESKGMNNIKDLITMVTEYEDDTFDITLPNYINAVRVMTFFKSKGLGFPIVINMFYDSSDRQDNMLFEKYDEKLRIYYITKNIARQSEKLDKLYNEDILEKRIQFLNVMYVATTRAMEELYNVVILRNKKYNECLNLFEEYTGGSKKNLPASPVPAAEPWNVKLPVFSELSFKEEEEEWTIGRLLETRKGDLFHEILHKIEFLDGDETTVDKIVELSVKNKKEPYNTAEIKKQLSGFLNNSDIKQWFLRIPDRTIQREVEYVNEEGSLYRFDRVVIDKNKITVLDFKTGTEKSDYYKKQIDNYVRILRKLHKDKEVTGHLIYINS